MKINQLDVDAIIDAITVLQTYDLDTSSVSMSFTELLAENPQLIMSEVECQVPSVHDTDVDIAIRLSKKMK